MAKIPLRSKNIDVNPQKETHEFENPLENLDDNIFQGEFSDDNYEPSTNVFSELEEENNPFATNIEDEEEEEYNIFDDNSSSEYVDVNNTFETSVKQNYNTNKYRFDTTAEIDLEIDPDIPYFFVFGNSTAGKSAMLSGLLYYIKTSGIGVLNSIGERGKSNHRKGDATLNNMIKKVKKGEFIEGTQTLDPTTLVFPTEINLKFNHNNGTQMPFCLLEMAGENLKDIDISSDGLHGGDLDARIKAYLEHPDCKLIFICVVDVDDPDTSENLIEEFLSYINGIGRVENPVLITVNKWDKVKNKYTRPEDFITENMPILKNRLHNETRPMYYMSYSIGDVISDNSRDSFKFNPEDSKRLFRWMYEISTGTKLSHKPNKSVIGSFKNLIKNFLKGE